jgi:hypothetical protein
MLDSRNVGVSYKVALRAAAAAAVLIVGAFGPAQAQGKKTIDLGMPPKLEVDLGSTTISFDDEFEFKGIACFANALNLNQSLSITVGNYTFNNLRLKPHYTGKNKVLSFYTYEGMLQIADGRFVSVEAKIQPLGRDENGEFCYLVKLEVDGAELSNTDFAEPVVITGSIGGQAFTFTVTPELEDDDDDD